MEEKIKRIRCAKCKQLFNEQFFRNQKIIFQKNCPRLKVWLWKTNKKLSSLHLLIQKAKN